MGWFFSNLHIHKTSELNIETTMNIKEYYNSIVNLSGSFLEKNSFKKSGSESVFYRYNVDKTKGWIIGFRKSLDNTSDWCRFIIKYGCLDTNDLAKYGIYHDRVRVKDLKMFFMNGYSLCDNIHELDWQVVENQDVDGYFKNNIEPELEKIIKNFHFEY